MTRGRSFLNLAILIALAVVARPSRAATRIRPPGPVTDAERQFWAFRPLAHTMPPDVKDAVWVRTPIDRFVLAKLTETGIAPTPPAAKGRLIRRVYFDLIGLPPSPHELDGILKDGSPDWYEKLVDRLLANPHFGERWGRHWLDVARYADSDGYEADADRPGMFHYRDFVIRAINDDLSFDTFVKWQLAGDEYAPKNPDALAATGFCTAGPVSTLKSGEGTPQEIEQYRYDALDDMVATTGAAFLGMTVACARCHDHKYDPITARDYYGLVAAFDTTKRVGGAFRFDEKPKPNVLEAAFKEPLWLTDASPEPARSWLLGRGNPQKKLEPITLGFLSALEPDGSSDRWIIKQKPSGATTTLQRTALAEWMTDVDHGAGALLARVIVNRLWQHHFGEGIVATPNDFGVQGDPPTHPELLDYLASQLVANGWRLKPIHRLILTSAVYLQDTTFDAARAKVDPDNHLLWRRRPMRLEAEALRDSILSASGKIDLTMFGPSIKPALPPEVMVGRNKDLLPRPKADAPDQWRRSIYLFTKRSLATPMMEAFDLPTPIASIGRRPQSTVATQALILMDSPLVRRQAELFADRCMAEGGPEVGNEIRRAYRIALSRDPTEHEEEAARQFIGSSRDRTALVNFCHMLMTLDEFAYVD